MSASTLASAAPSAHEALQTLAYFDPTAGPGWIVLPWLADQVEGNCDPETINEMHGESYSDDIKEFGDVKEAEPWRSNRITSVHKDAKKRVLVT